MNPIEHAEYDAGWLAEHHPPRFRDPNKQIAWEIARSSGFPFKGQVVYTCWGEQTPPEQVTGRGQFTIRTGVFDYASTGAGWVDWHVNFADPVLFGFYGSSLLAQDELQTLEHPILGSLREALISEGYTARTIGAGGKATPVTVTGVQRRCVLNTLPDPAAGRPGGLYGNAFGRAPGTQIRAAVRPVNPPTLSNILAIAAPAGGSGAYRADTLSSILRTAFSGFAAARQESERLAGTGCRTVIHTGFWGCGAFGGNRELMTILQALAGDLAGVDIVYWTFDVAGQNQAAKACSAYEALREASSGVESILNQLFQRKYTWGFSDGN